MSGTLKSGAITLLHELADVAAQRWPTRTALRYRQADTSYLDVVERSRRLAAGLAACGIGRGDRVVVYLQNRPEVIKLALACSRLGAIFVPANPMLRGRQLRHLVQDSGARLLVASHGALSQLKELRDACSGLRTLVVCDANGAVPPVDGEWLRYEDLVAHDAHQAGPPVIDRDPAAILYTSGSTGRAKGVVISHRNLISGAGIVATYLGNTPEDRLLGALPLSFDYGFSQATTAFSVGACLVLTNYSTAAALVMEVAAERITALAGVPTMWAHLAEAEWPAEVARTLRYVTNSGGVLPAVAQRKLEARLPATRIFCMYGLTEAFRSTYLDPADLASRPTSFGKAIANQEVLVLRPDGSQCSPGETGELVHRGSLVTLGYWNNPEATRERFRPVPSPNAGLVDECAVWSGDLVRSDADGFLYFIGRRDQQIKTSGYRVSPSEIEEVVLEAPGVIEAAAIGLPDETLGSRIVVAVVARSPEGRDPRDEIRQYCRMHLPSYMVPTHVQVMESLPRNSNGKVDRAVLAATLEARVPASPETAYPGRVPR